MELDLKRKEVNSSGVRLSLEKDGAEIGRGFLYLMYNDLHKEPFGLIEDVFVDEQYRGQGLGTRLVEAIIEEAKERKCYKLLCTSRYAREKVHAWYKKLGFEDYGKEFRMNF